jgi:hypothetical protein
MLAPIVKIFCEIDDFCKHFFNNQQAKILPNPKRKDAENEGIANLGKHSMGWFFGFKLHLVINHQGEPISCCFTKGNQRIYLL